MMGKVCLYPMHSIRYKVYADLYPSFEINRDKLNNKQGADARKSDLLYRVVLYLTVKCLYPVSNRVLKNCLTPCLQPWVRSESQ
jgi:hypothetical protein